jgi:hypothetical protein
MKKSLLLNKGLLHLVLLLFFTTGIFAQTQGWYVSANFGANLTNGDGRFSSYNSFETYGKVPYDLPGYPTYFFPNDPFPASGFMYQLSLNVGYAFSNRVNIGLRFALQPNQQDVNNSGTTLYGEEREPYKDGSSNYFFSFSILSDIGYVFKKREHSFWTVYAIAGFTQCTLKESVYGNSELTVPGVFNGTTEEYLKRSDWAFTWGGGISYTYLFGKHWGITAAAEVTTFNMKPDKIERYSYKINGEELVSTLPLREREILLGDDLVDYPDNPNIPQALPAENYRFIIPQITLGVVYAL